MIILKSSFYNHRLSSCVLESLRGTILCFILTRSRHGISEGFVWLTFSPDYLTSSQLDSLWNRRRPSLWSGINKQGSCRLEGGLGGPWRKILWSVPLQKRFQVSQEYKMKRRDYLLYKSERKSKGECNIWTKSNHWNRLCCNYCNYTHSYFEHDKWLHREPYLPLRLELPHISSILPSHVIIIY